MSLELRSCSLIIKSPVDIRVQIEKEFDVSFDQSSYDELERVWSISIGSYFEQEYTDRWEIFDKLVVFLNKNSDKMRTMGVCFIALTISYNYYGQCNMSFPEFAQFRGAIDDLRISCFKCEIIDEDEDENSTRQK